MRTEDALVLEELTFDEPDMTSALTLPDLRRYLEDDSEADGELGLRTLLENPEALSPSLRAQSGL